MIELKCPNCNANINLDDNREFGFCSYCGTKIQLVQTVKVVHEGTLNVSGTNILEQQLESAKKMFDIGEYYESERMYKKIVEEYPDCGEAWLNLAILRNRDKVSRFLSQPTIYWEFPNWTPEHISERMIDNFSNSTELIKAKKLLGQDGAEAIQKMIAEYKSEILDSFSNSQEIIDNYKHDLRLLIGFKYDCESGNNDFKFVEHEGQICIWPTTRKVLEINSNNEIVLEKYIVVRNGLFSTKREFPGSPLIKIIFADGDRLYTSRGIMWKKN